MFLRYHVKKSLFLSFVFFVTLCAGCTAPDRPEVAALNQPAPDFKLQDAAGTGWQLSDLTGKVVFLNFWATWCPPCREEMPSMIKLNRLMQGKPFVMLTVLVNDDPGKAAQFVKMLGGGLSILVDPDSEAYRKFGLTGVPETFIIDKKGILREKYIGAWPWDSAEAQQMLARYL